MLVSDEQHKNWLSQRLADFLLLSEQNHSRQESEGWFADSSGRSLIALLSPLPLRLTGTAEDGFRWVETLDMRIYSCYWSPNSTLADFQDFLTRLEISVRSSGVPVIVAGDFNVKSRMWGSPKEDARGALLAGMVAALDLAVCNEGNVPLCVVNRSPIST